MDHFAYQRNFITLLGGNGRHGHQRYSQSVQGTEIRSVSNGKLEAYLDHFCFLRAERAFTVYFIPLLDLDECQNDLNYCHKMATCTNERGSYTCKCKAGYVGDGLDCYHHSGEMCLKTTRNILFNYKKIAIKHF